MVQEGQNDSSSSEDGNIQVLIVEDDADTAALLTQQLGSRGYELSVARNGQEAILVTGQQPPNLVVMDVMMPRLNGFEATRFLKAKFRQTFVPILVLTARDDADSRREGARFGCDEYLTKPYRKAHLLGAVAELLALSAAENHFLAIEKKKPVKDADVEEGSSQQVWDESFAGATRQVVEARLVVARRQCSQGSSQIARTHLERVLQLDAGNTTAAELLRQIED